MIIETPKWARELIAEYAPKYHLTWEHTNTYVTRGFCWQEKKEILIQTNGLRKTKSQLFVLLHEIAHTMKGKEHNAEFYAVAAELYAWHGVLEFAAQHEYPNGRQILTMLNKKLKKGENKK